MIRPLVRATLVCAVIGAGVLGLHSFESRELPFDAAKPAEGRRPCDAPAGGAGGRPRETRTAAAQTSSTRRDVSPVRDAAEVQAGQLREWARVDPHAAARAAGELPLPERRLAIGSVIGIWSESALSEAVEWACGLANEEFRTEAMLAVGYELARSRPAEAVQLSAWLRRSPEVDALLVHALTQWAERDPVAASRWSATVTDEPARYRMQAAIAQAWGEHDALSALAFALETLPPGRHQELALVGITLRWVQHAPADVAALLETFPAGGLRDTMLKDVVRIWSSRDARATEVWLKNLRCEAMRSDGLRLLRAEGAGSKPAPAARSTATSDASNTPRDARGGGA